MNYLFLTQLAASEYNCGAYGVGNYDEGACQTTTPGGSTGTDTGNNDLAPTGMNVVLLLVLGLVLVAISAAYFVRQLYKRKAKATRLS